MTAHEFLVHPLTRGVLTGVLSAAAVDIAAFRSWKSFHDAATYAWGLAAWRWCQGAVIGLLTAAGLNGVA